MKKYKSAFLFFVSCCLFILTSCDSNPRGAILALSPSIVTQTVGDTQAFTVTATYDDGTAETVTSGLVWSSSDDFFVTVSDDGVATAVAVGSATITVMQTSTGRSALATVNVALPDDEPADAVSIYTVGGTVTGLSGTLVLQNNLSDDLSVSANGDFTFATSLDDGADYDVSVLTQPDGQTCTVSNSSGTMGSSNVTNVSVNCATNTSTLNASVSELALSVTGATEYGVSGTPSSGVARTITVTNTGSYTVTNLLISYPAWPAGTIASSNCGSSLTASASCTITITPGNTATSDGTDPCTVGTAPIAQTITISADNADTVLSDAVILGYGCIYQGGYVYALDDTTVTSTSVGGKVAATSDQSDGILWSSNGSSSVSYVAILGIDELSTILSPSPTSPSYPLGTPAYTACEGKSDGACNTSNIVSYYNFNRASGGDAPTPLNQYAAGLCKATIDSYSDWYLPAICEEGYDDSGSGTGCGAQVTPTMQNMLSNLFDAGVGDISGEYWSSTEWVGDDSLYVWSQTFDIGNVSQFTFDKSYNTIRVRCSRALTP